MSKQATGGGLVRNSTGTYSLACAINIGYCLLQDPSSELLQLVSRWLEHWDYVECFSSVTLLHRSKFFSRRVQSLINMRLKFSSLGA
ncbi:hypothetical protein LINPERPRIM_LOCUS18876 [Linum perenne]